MAEKVLKRELSADDRQFNKNKWLFSVSGIGRDISYQLIASFLLVYIQFGVQLNVAQFTAISLIIGVAGRIWDAVNDPMMGAIIEGSHMKWGKFKPWIFIGAVTCGAVIITMFNVQSLSGWSFVIFMSVMYLLWETTFTMNDISYWSMLASLSSKKHQRDSVTLLTVVFAGIGAFIGQGGISFLYPGNVRNAFAWISIGVVAIFIIMQTVCALFVKESPRLNVEKNEKVSLKHMWNTIKHNDQILWMTLVMLFYTVASTMLVGLAYNLYYIEIGYDGSTIVFIAIFGVLNVAAQSLYPMLSRKLGRKKLQLWSVIIACVGYVGIALLGWTAFLPFNLLTLSTFGSLVFIGQSLYYMACIINMTNCVEYNEYKRGERNEAVVSTLRPFTAKFSDAIKYGAITLVLTISGVFLLSQNVSTLEAQKGYFDRMTFEQQIAYVQAVDEYYVLLPEKGASDYDAKIAELNALLEKDEELSKYQVQAEYVRALGDIGVAKDGKVIGFLKDIDHTTLSKNGTYTFVVSGKDANGNDFNAANENFRAESTLTMRLWIRGAVTILPIILILISLFIQRKKFIIDEDYYDMMLAEIDKKRAEKQEALIGDAK